MTSKLLKNAIFIDIHCHKLKGSNSCFNIYNYDPYLDNDAFTQGPFSCGIHPWSLRWPDIQNKWVSIQKLMKLHHCLFIGETGLDKSISIDISAQEEMFIKHIEQSIVLSKPLIIHCVKALNEVVYLKKKYPNSPAWIIHDFNGNKEMIEMCLPYNIYFSLGNRFCISKRSKVAKSLQYIPITRLLFETDDCDDLKIEQVYKSYAKQMNIELSTLCQHINHNLRSLF